MISENYSRFVQCHTLVNVFLHVRHVDMTVYIYYRSLVRATFLGVGCQGGCSSRLYPVKTGTVGLLPTSTPWMFAFLGFSAVSDLDIWLSIPLLRVLPRLTVSSVIGGVSEVVGEYLQSLPRDLAWLFSSAWYSNHVGSLRSCIWVHLLLHSSVVGILFSRSLHSYWKDYFALVSGFPGNIILDFCSCCPFTKKVSTGRFPSLWWDFYCSHISSFYVRRRV